MHSLHCAFNPALDANEDGWIGEIAYTEGLESLCKKMLRLKVSDDQPVLVDIVIIEEFSEDFY